MFKLIPKGGLDLVGIEFQIDGLVVVVFVHRPAVIDHVDMN